MRPFVLLGGSAAGMSDLATSLRKSMMMRKMRMIRCCWCWWSKATDARGRMAVAARKPEWLCYAGQREDVGGEAWYWGSMCMCC